MLPILYDYFRSSSSYRVRIALALKNIAYETIPISLLDLDNLKPEYLNLNPQGLVPTWVDEQLTLSQSLCIIEYLDECYPKTPRLIPEEIHDKYKAKELSYIISCDMGPLLNNARIKRYFVEHNFGEQAFLEWYHHWLKQGFDAYETHLLKQPDAQFSIGQHISIADLCLIPQIINAKRFEFDMQSYSKIMNIFNNCMKIPAFYETQP